MNELIESWEEGAGVREFVILTAQASEAHLEALSTIRTDEARVQVIDVFSLDFGALLERPAPRSRAASSTRPSCCSWPRSWSAWTWRRTSP